MKLSRIFAVIVLGICASALAFAQDVTFFNHGGTFTSNNAQNALYLDGTNGSTSSSLFGVTGLPAGWNCGGTSPACSGTVSLYTGALLSSPGANTLLPLSLQTSYFGAGGGFDVVENKSAGVNGFTFAGTFSSESWSCTTGFTCIQSKTNKNKYIGTWTLVGQIVNATLTIGGHVYTVAQAATVQLTTLSGTVTYAKNKPLTFLNSSGNTGFPSPVPEPGTGALTLFGCALIAVAVISKKMVTSSSAR